MGHKWSGWCRFDTFVHKAGQQWFGWAKVWQEDTIETYVSACWQPEFQEGWILISDQNAGKARINEYAKRMRVEATFQESKSRFDRHDRRDKGIFRLGRLWPLDILRRAPKSGAVCSCLPFARRQRGWSFCYTWSGPGFQVLLLFAVLHHSF